MSTPVRCPGVMRLLALFLILTAAAAPDRPAERRYPLSSFSGIRVLGPFDVTVTTGVQQGAVAQGKLDDLDRMSVQVEDDMLVVRSDPGAWGSAGKPGKVTLHVTAPAIASASVSGKGRLSVDRLTGDQANASVMGAGTIEVHGIAALQLTAIVSGIGAMTLAGHAGALRARALGQVDLDASALATDALTLFSESAGTVRLASRGHAKVTNVGPGSVSVTGGATCEIKGNAPVDCGAKRKP